MRKRFSALIRQVLSDKERQAAPTRRDPPAQRKQAGGVALALWPTREGRVPETKVDLRTQLTLPSDKNQPSSSPEQCSICGVGDKISVTTYKKH